MKQVGNHRIRIAEPAFGKQMFTVVAIPLTGIGATPVDGKSIGIGGCASGNVGIDIPDAAVRFRIG